MHPKSPNRTDTFSVIYCKSQNRKVNKHSNLDFHILILQSDKKREENHGKYSQTMRDDQLINGMFGLEGLSFVKSGSSFYSTHKWLVDVVKSCNNVKLLKNELKIRYTKSIHKIR